MRNENIIKTCGKNERKKRTIVLLLEEGDVMWRERERERKSRSIIEIDIRGMSVL
jgi:hypothetical protein